MGRILGFPIMYGSGKKFYITDDRIAAILPRSGGSQITYVVTKEQVAYYETLMGTEEAVALWKGLQEKPSEPPPAPLDIGWTYG